MVAKNGASVYVERRSREWLKVKVNQEEEFVIGGYTLPAGTRHPLRSAASGAYRGADLRYVGAWEPATLRRHSPPSIGASSRWSGRRRRSPIRLASRERRRPIACRSGGIPEWTDEAKLRQPVFQLDDKRPGEVVLPEQFP